jgi:putative component of membrane protein insertase Oxa1/YidC/SpoIIIJ protein YidD
MKKILLLVIFPLVVLSYSFEEPWGKDSNLTYFPKKKEEEPKLSVLTQIAHKIIIFKQKVISPVDGPRSSFRPTSSKYMQLAMKRYGFFKGYIMGCDRLLRENDEKWFYRTISINGVDYKYDPAVTDKFTK